MLLFAHVGIALGMARFARRLDLAFLALGSMLPDIIDKPMGWVIFGTPNNGRIFAHTLLFLLLVAALAFYLHSIAMASLAGGTFIHLVLDSMWVSPVILLWPILGGFPPAAHLDALSYIEMLLLGLRDPAVLVPELLGLAYLVYFVYERRQSLGADLKPALRCAIESLQVLFRGM